MKFAAINIIAKEMESPGSREAMSLETKLDYLEQAIVRILDCGITSVTMAELAQHTPASLTGHLVPDEKEPVLSSL